MSRPDLLGIMASGGDIPALHLVGIGAGDTNGVVPDLVAQARAVEPGEVGPLEPLGLPGATPSAGGRGSLLDEEDRLSSLGQAVGHGDAGGTRTDDDVVIRLVRGHRAASIGSLGSLQPWMRNWWSAHRSRHTHTHISWQGRGHTYKGRPPQQQRLSVG